MCSVGILITVEVFGLLLLNFQPVIIHIMFVTKSAHQLWFWWDCIGDNALSQSINFIFPRGGLV